MTIPAGRSDRSSGSHEVGTRALGARLVVADWGAEVCGDAIRIEVTGAAAQAAPASQDVHARVQVATAGPQYTIPGVKMNRLEG